MANNKVTARKFEPGKGPGRPKGSVNKTTALLKDAILLAAEQAGGKDGLVGYLRRQAEENPGPFLTLVGKVLPLQISGENGKPIQFEEMSPRERIERRIASTAAGIAATRDPEGSDGS